MKSFKGLLGAGAVFVVFVLGAVPAVGFEGHSFSGSFGSAGSGAGQLALVSNSGVAVNSTTHDVYVADTGNHRVDEFSAGGVFLRAWGWGVADGLPALETCTLVCQAGLAGNGAGELSAPTFVAVDNTAGASAGDVYVADTARKVVEKFDASGNLVAGWGSGGVLDGSSATGGPFAGIVGIAVDTTGDLFVHDPNGIVWFEFGQDGTPGVPFSDRAEPSDVGVGVDASGNLYAVIRGVTKIEPSGEIVGPVDGEAQDTGFVVDEVTGDIFVDEGGGSIAHFDSSCVPSGGGVFGAPCAVADAFAGGDLAGGAGLGVDTSSDAVYAADVDNQRVVVFSEGHYADVNTEPASEVTPNTATLNGHLDPAGNGEITACDFEYIDDAAFQAHAYGAPGVVSAVCAEGASFSAPASVHVDLGALLPSTTYHFRLDALDAQGVSHGADQTFTTPPAVKDVSTNPATGVLGHSATLNGTLDPNGQGTTYHFQYVTDTAFQASGYSTAVSAPVPDADAGSTPGDQSVHVDVTGLTPTTIYHFRLIAGNGNGVTVGQDETFSTPPPPAIDNTGTKNLTASTVDLTASINPNGTDTTYRFEYGTSTAYGTSIPVPDADIGVGTSDVSVTQHVAGLEAGTKTYHWRVVATNPSGTSTSPDHTFVYATGGEGLPDNRAYEMVTPPKKNGALIGDVSFVSPLIPNIAADGSRVMVGSIQCFAHAESCNGLRGNPVGSPYEFTRTPDGWVTTSLAPPATQFTASTPWAYNATTGTALFSMSTPPFGEDDFYVRNADRRLLDIGPTVPPGVGAQAPTGGAGGGEGGQAQTADFSHFVWETGALWPLDAPGGGYQVYEYVGTGNSQPLSVGVSGREGSHDLISACGTGLGVARQSRLGTFSADGRTVFFTAEPKETEPCPSGTGANAGTPVPAMTVYARVDGEEPDAHTVAISHPSPSECGGGSGQGEKGCREAASDPANAVFEGASSDGSKAFFTSTQQLTDTASEDSQNGHIAGNVNCALQGSGCDLNLYEYDAGSPAGHHLVDASVGDSSGAGPRVQGVVALSADGSHVYFVAKGVLGGINDRGQSAQSGANNLYVFERDAEHPAGQTIFITDLPISDEVEWRLAGDPANVTPDGRFLVFVSHGALTADDTSASRASQVFRYDAATGTLTRISVSNDGFNDNGNRSTPTLCEGGGDSCAEDDTILAVRDAGGRWDPSMSDDGRFVFFQSPVALTPGALDDVQIATNSVGVPVYEQNVYEWHEGHVYLISDGRDASASIGASACGFSAVCLLGSDASGANVFFSTADRLVGQDTDTELDYYDARICTAADPCVPSSSPVGGGCQGEACHGTASGAPSTPAAVTVGYAGAGNLAPAPFQQRKPAVKAKKKHPKKKKDVKHRSAKKRAKRGVVRRAARLGAGGKSRNGGNRS
jgi:NHL repeat